MKKFLLPIVGAIAAMILSNARLAAAANEPCGIELLNVPVGATIRVSAYWKSDDTDDGIEDEGYKFVVDDGGSGGTLSIWRQPFVTYNMAPFRATGPRVSVSGFKDPQSTMHNEGTEREGCVITATINGWQPWVKDYARTSFPYLSIGGAGLLLIGNLHPGVKAAGAGVAFTAVVAKVLADDPIDCSSFAIVRPVFDNSPAGPEDDAIGILGNRIARNGTRTLGIARAAVTNVNRANCNDFTQAQRQALNNAAANQGARIGNHVARLKTQLNNLTLLLEQAGLVIDAINGQLLINDWQFNFITDNDPALDNLLEQVLTADELNNFKDGVLGVPLIDFHACNDGSGPCRLYPALWPTDGVLWMAPALDQWSASLIAKEQGQ